MVHAEEYTIEIARTGRVVETPFGTGEEWLGYAVLDHVPVNKISGLEITSQKKDFNTQEPVFDEEGNPVMKTQIGLREVQFTGEKPRSYGYLDVYKWRKEDENTGEVKEGTTISKSKYQFEGLVFPVLGFLNEKPEGASCKIKFNEKAFEESLDPKWRKDYLKKYKNEAPIFIIEDRTVDFSEVIEELRLNPLYPEYIEWHSKWFPSSYNTAQDKEVAARRDNLFAMTKRVQAAKAQQAAQPQRPAPRVAQPQARTAAPSRPLAGAGAARSMSEAAAQNEEDAPY